ncbi:hypothetical protein [Methanococcoides methylutens]|uniref:hypothetical protein n=1 Tax=Methanococcoides methylutens TaxID=2226 RepID=UPI00064FC494|nr:hypothetical protein [Methanococcoides methylutens]
MGVEIVGFLDVGAIVLSVKEGGRVQNSGFVKVCCGYSKYPDLQEGENKKGEWRLGVALVALDMFRA